MPRVCSTSGNDTPAACTSTTTPAPGLSACEASGAGSSTSSSDSSGPDSRTIWTAFTGGIMSSRPALCGLDGLCSDALPAEVQLVAVTRAGDRPQLMLAGDRVRRRERLVRAVVEDDHAAV